MFYFFSDEYPEWRRRRFWRRVKWTLAVILLVGLATGVAAAYDYSRRDEFTAALEQETDATVRPLAEKLTAAARPELAISTVCQGIPRVTALTLAPAEITYGVILANVGPGCALDRVDVAGIEFEPIKAEPAVRMAVPGVGDAIAAITARGEGGSDGQVRFTAVGTGKAGWFRWAVATREVTAVADLAKLRADAVGRVRDAMTIAVPELAYRAGAEQRRIAEKNAEEAVAKAKAERAAANLAAKAAAEAAKQGTTVGGPVPGVLGPVPKLEFIGGAATPEEFAKKFPQYTGQPVTKEELDAWEKANGFN